MAGEKKPAAKVKSKKKYYVGKVFEISGESIKSKNKKCPKCSVFMAEHNGRRSCGKCGYTEFK